MPLVLVFWVLQATPLKPASEMAHLRYFEGTWKCDAKVLAADGTPDHPVKSKIVAKLDLDRFWLSVQMAEQKAKDYAAPHANNGFWGYDAEGQNLTRIGVGNRGDSETATSTGWSGDQFVWSGAINNYGGERVPFRHTVNRNGPRDYTEKIEINRNGEWRQVASGSCQKQ